MAMLTTFANSKICYLKNARHDTARSAEFYERGFGWNLGKRKEGW